MTRALLALVLLFAQQGKQIPPPGVPVPDADRTQLEADLNLLKHEIEGLRKAQPELIVDVEVFHKAVEVALTHNEFLNAKEIPVGKDLLKVGLERAKELREGKPGWATATGLVPRAYASKIDGSLQPYGLVVPPTYKAGSDRKHRLDFWLHGRDESLTELRFLQGRLKSAGEFTPADTIVCHLYGRFCNASKFAGEVDLFEALDSIKKRYPIDENRICVRGFSMGGASTWHLAAHHAGLWACAAPGAGFAETPIYANIYKDPVKPTPWQETLWHWYNATDYAANLFNCPVVAYSGENDKQKAAADTMAKVMKEEGLDLIHVIGPKVEHKYEPEAKKEVARRVDEFATKGRDPNPKKIRFTTWTLRYNQMRWVTVDGLDKHWERATVDAEQDAGKVTLTTKNVSALSIDLKGLSKIVIDGQELAAAPSLRKIDGTWSAGAPEGARLKRHGLQGPIDDAFMDSFVMVVPSGKPMNEKTGAWVAAEQARAIEMWRRFFRGDARVVKDDAVTEALIASSNLVCWGDPQSNKLLEGIVEKLPIKWTPKEIKVGSQAYPADSHVPVLIYPNPLNPKRYVVLNSGFTFQDQAPASNSRHVPMLPDWAVMDVTAKKVVAADFFGERWELK
ncbi:MAG TPA: prolyl oligopeptidase family serine peptidase [Planctomycetota bacterium]|nr:prolyl oligopeptidase family serine peptidase [Planctomycetota bacterium]